MTPKLLKNFVIKGKAGISLGLVLTLVGFLVPVVPAVQAVTPEFTVDTGTVLASNFIGHGAEYNQNLYAAISAVDGITPENAGYLETKVKQLQSQHVRIFFDNKAFDTVNYPDYMSSFIRTVELAQSSGSPVNITYWHGPYTNIPQQMSDFAGVLYDLVVTRGLSAVQYVTIQNEVNSTSITMDMYQQLYRELHTQLTNRGIRSRVKFIGGDLVRTNQQAWFDYMAANMNDILDGYSIHIYWNHWDRAYANTRLSEVRAIIDAMAPAAQKPVYITEYGVRGDTVNCGEPYQPGCLQGTLTPLGDTVLNAFQHAWFQMKAASYKYVATVKWDAYKAKYDNGTQYFSEIGSGNGGYPTRPVYNVTRLFTHSGATPGWQIVGVNGAVPGKLVSALNDPATGNMAVYALNDTGAATTIAVGGLAANKQFRLLVWNDEATGGIKNYGTVQTDGAGTIAMSLNSQSFAVLTTLNPGDLDQVGLYHLDETAGTTAADSSPYANHGTLFNGAAWTTGKIGGALDLDGVNDYATLPPNMINPAETTSGFSAAAWVKLRASSGAVQLILQQDGATGRIWLNRRGDGALETYLGGIATISTGTIPVGVWTHVAVTYDGTNVRLWLNGNLEATNAVTAEAATDRLIVGADKTFGQLWNGQIDELTIYNRKLPQPDIEDLYNSGYWKFDETSGTTANDDPSTGYNNAGTLFGGATWTTAGKVNGALDLDGASGYAKLPNLVNPAVQTFSAAAWVKLRATPGTVQHILQQEGASGRIWLDRKGNGTLETNIGNISTVSTGTIPIGVWTHVAVTYDGTTVKLYLNGQPDGSRVVIAESSTGGMIVGANKTFGALWNGQIDNLHIYDRRLTAANVLDLYNQSR